MSDGMRRELAYLSSHATNRYFIPNWGYLVTMSQLKIGRMKGLLLTFYVFLFGGILLFIGTETISQLQPISEWHTAGNLILLALIPTVVSNLALVRAVKSIGSTDRKSVV